jgi:hypothetical protein
MQESIEELKNTDLYRMIEKMLEHIPENLRAITADLIQHETWFEIGCALNSFPITEEVNKFKLVEKLKPYMRKKNISFLQISDEIEMLEKKGWISIKKIKMPNYFCSFEFAQAVQATRVIKKEFLQPLTATLKNRKEFESCNVEECLSQLICLILKKQI